MANEKKKTLDPAPSEDIKLDLPAASVEEPAGDALIEEVELPEVEPEKGISLILITLSPAS